MLKLDLKLIFWSLAVHIYPKQTPRVIIFAAMGPRMKLVIDRNSLAKKMKAKLLQAPTGSCQPLQSPASSCGLLPAPVGYYQLLLAPAGSCKHIQTSACSYRLL